MAFEFTPAAERALAVAAGWSSCADANGLDVPEVLLGLLAEPECRAALLLARNQVDAAAVRLRFSNLTAIATPEPHRANHFSTAFQTCLSTAQSLLLEHPQPLLLATEHLLLGIVATPNEVSGWLAERGMNASELEAEVHRLAGHQPGPLPLDMDEASDTADEVEAIAFDARTFEGVAGEISAHEQIAALRIIDAAANRAGEGLRVVEDYVRFALDDRHLTALAKSIRHDLTTVLEVFPSDERHAARDTRGDVGTELSLATEQARDDAQAVAAANFKRVEQSLRSLEEFSKTCAPQAAVALEQLRYRVYTLERAVDVTRYSIEQLAEAGLYVLIDAGSTPDAFRTLVESLVAARVSVIQLREKNLADRDLVARGRTLVELTRGTPTLAILNDRADLAVLCGADGVHLGQDDLPIKDARRILGPTPIIGVSTHSLEQARRAVLEGANYLGVGPTFPSGTKQFTQFPGLEFLRAVHAEIRLPVFAIGGITAQNLPQVLDTGITRVAVSGAVAMTQDPRAAAAILIAALAGDQQRKKSG